MPPHSMGMSRSQPGMGGPGMGGPPGPGMGMPPQPSMGMPPQPSMGGPPGPGMGMPPQPGYPGGGGGYPGGGLQQQRKALDPDSMPNPIQVMADDKVNSGQFVTNEKGKVPPLVTTEFTTYD